MTSESQEWILRTFNENKPIFQIFAKNPRKMQFWQFFFEKTAVILLDKAKTEQNKTKQISRGGDHPLYPNLDSLP